MNKDVILLKKSYLTCTKGVRFTDITLTIIMNRLMKIDHVTFCTLLTSDRCSAHAYVKFYKTLWLNSNFGGLILTAFSRRSRIISLFLSTIEVEVSPQSYRTTRMSVRISVGLLFWAAYAFGRLSSVTFCQNKNMSNMADISFIVTHSSASLAGKCQLLLPLISWTR